MNPALTWLSLIKLGQTVRRRKSQSKHLSISSLCLITKYGRRAFDQYTIACEVEMIRQYLQRILCRVQSLPSFPPPRPCNVLKLLQTQQEMFFFTDYLKTYNKEVIKFCFRFISWIIKPRHRIYLTQPSPSMDSLDLDFDTSCYHVQTHPKISYFCQSRVIGRIQNTKISKQLP